MKIKPILLSILLLLGSFSVSAESSSAAVQSTSNQKENLVENYDFEGWGAHPWYVWVEDSNTMVRASIDQNESVTGNQSLVIEVITSGARNRIELHQQHFSFTKGQKLTFSVWAKSENVRTAKLIVNHRQPPWEDYGGKWVTITKDWQEFFASVEITENDDIVGIYIELKDDINGKVWFDAVRFYEEY